MGRQPTYGWALVATLVGATIAAVVMSIPSWLWANYVVDVKFNSIVGRSEELETGERFLLYAGNLLIVFAGLAVYTWATRRLLDVFADHELPWWDVFFALTGTALLAAFVGFWFPFLGLLIAVFLTPAAMLSWSTSAGSGVTGGRRDQPLTSLRPG